MSRPLEELAAATREALFAAGRVRRYARGQVLFHQGDHGDSLHILREGRVAIRLTSPQGVVLTLSVMGPDEMFGEMAMLGIRAQRTATVTALDDVETLEITRDGFEKVRADHREVDDLLLLLLVRRVDRLSRLVAEAHYMGVDQRVARRLYEVGRYYVGEGLPVVVPLTQDDVAGLAGTTRPSANAALRKLEERGIVRLGRGRVEILNPTELRKRADH